jgi:3-methyladenine DNA glycosylase AlkC
VKRAMRVLTVHGYDEKEFLAVDRMSSESRVWLRRLTSSASHIALPSWHALSRSPSRQKEP